MSSNNIEILSCEAVEIDINNKKELVFNIRFRIKGKSNIGQMYYPIPTHLLNK